MALMRVGVLVLGALLGCTQTPIVLRPADAGPEATDATLALAATVSAANDHTCATRDGALRCTGSGRSLALGLPDGADRLSLERVAGIEDAVEVQTGYGFTCMLRANARLYCFGTNERGQLGTGDLSPRTTPTEVLLPGAVVAFSAAFDHACAVLRSGALYCWGSNAEHELGQGEGAPLDRSIPVEVAPGTAFVEVSAGQGHTCAIAIDGAIHCTGRNLSGECGLGADTADQITVPTAIPGRRFRHVAAGQNHTCAIGDDGGLFCWGSDVDADGYPGPGGLAGSTSHDTPTAVGLETDWSAISTDTFHTCGLRGAGDLWCWGRNAEGQLGAGDMSVIDGPVHVEPTLRFDRVDVGRFHTCARRSDGAAMCAGRNGSGELGVGDLMRRAVLTELAE